MQTFAKEGYQKLLSNQIPTSEYLQMSYAVHTLMFDTASKKINVLKFMKVKNVRQSAKAKHV